MVATGLRVQTIYKSEREIENRAQKNEWQVTDYEIIVSSADLSTKNCFKSKF